MNEESLSFVASLWNSPNGSDIILSFGGQWLYAHSAILTRTSTYFRGIFRTNSASQYIWKEAREGFFQFPPDEDIYSLERMLLYMYERRGGLAVHWNCPPLYSYEVEDILLLIKELILANKYSVASLEDSLLGHFANWTLFFLDTQPHVEVFKVVAALYEWNHGALERLRIMIAKRCARIVMAEDFEHYQIFVEMLEDVPRLAIETMYFVKKGLLKNNAWSPFD